jgi:hypothetical protein
MMEYLAGSSGLTYVCDRSCLAHIFQLCHHHVPACFIPLIGFLGIYIHSLRLSRARWWSPRWVSIQAVVGLIVFRS